MFEKATLIEFNELELIVLDDHKLTNLVVFKTFICKDACFGSVRNRSKMPLFKLQHSKYRIITVLNLFVMNIFFKCNRK